MRRNMRVDWASLRGEVEDAFQRYGVFPFPVHIDGRLNTLGEGLNHKNFVFRLETDRRWPLLNETVYVLRTLGRDYEDASQDKPFERLQFEARTLQALASLQLDFATPQFVCYVGNSSDSPSGLIETALPGLPCEYMIRDKGDFIIDLIAQAAAAIHRIPVDDFCFLTRHTDNRAHILTELDMVSAAFTTADADATAGIEWIQDHLPNRKPSVLLHGDLLPQNLLWDYEADRISVVDWEFAQIGDPAYDLAIVTRGNRKLCGCGNGLNRLVDAYGLAGGANITTIDVVIHELLMVLLWLGEAIQSERKGRCQGHPPAFYRDKLQTILRRTKGRTRKA